MKPQRTRLLGRRPAGLVPLRFRSSEKRKASASRRALREFQTNADGGSSSDSPAYMNILPSAIVKKYLKKDSAKSERSAPSDSIHEMNLRKSMACNNLSELRDPHDQSSAQEAEADDEDLDEKLRRYELTTLRRRLWDLSDDESADSQVSRDAFSLSRQSSLETIQLDDEECVGLDVSDNTGSSRNGAKSWPLPKPYPLIRTKKRKKQSSSKSV